MFKERILEKTTSMLKFTTTVRKVHVNLNARCNSCAKNARFRFCLS